MKFLFVTDKFGALGNRLFRFARFYAEKPDDVVFIDLSLYQYTHCFSPKIFPYNFIFPILSQMGKSSFETLRERLFFKFAAIVPSKPAWCSDSHPSSGEIFRQVKASRRKIHYINEKSYYYVPSGNASPRRSALANIFSLKDRYQRVADRILTALPFTGTLVGVHVRRGDYKVFEDGRHFFEDRDYHQAIKRFEAINGHHGPFAYILVSNEAVSLEGFPHIPIYNAGVQELATDMAILAKCQFIIGAESTFSAWPSFLHEIPKFTLSRATKESPIEYTMEIQSSEIPLSSRQPCEYA